MKTTALLLLLLLHACATDKLAQQTGIEEITFGSGGGFTGKVTSYVLNTTGQLTEKENPKGLSKKLTRETTTECFKLAQELKTYSYKKPDNLYSFIEIRTKENTNRIVWGFGSTHVNERTTQLFNKLISQTK